MILQPGLNTANKTDTKSREKKGTVATRSSHSLESESPRGDSNMGGRGDPFHGRPLSDPICYWGIFLSQEAKKHHLNPYDHPFAKWKRFSWMMVPQIFTSKKLLF